MIKIHALVCEIQHVKKIPWALDPRVPNVNIVSMRRQMKQIKLIMRWVMVMWREYQTRNWVTVRKSLNVEWKWWIRSENEDDDDEALNTRMSDDPLKSDMQGKHANNECNDGMDDDLELLRESHSSHSQDIRQNEYKAWGIPRSSHTNFRQQTCSIKWPSNIHTYSVIDNNTHMLLFFFPFFLQHINELYMLWTHTKKTQRRDQKWIKMLSNINISQTLSDEVTFSNWGSLDQCPWDR